MEPFVIEILAWVGRLVAQKIAGHALAQGWKRLSMSIQSVLSKGDALHEVDKAVAEVVDRSDAKNAEAASVLKALLARNAELEMRNQELEAENAALRARVSGPDEAG